MREIMLIAAILISGYLLGSISTGILISSRAGVNIREEGSKNTGASNVLRVLGISRGAVTFLGDALKAAIACLIGSLLLPDATCGIERLGMMVGGVAAILGHNWPVFYGFKGGKGIASSTAVLLFIDPLFGGIAIAVFVVVLLVTKYISVSSMLLLFTFFVLTCVFHSNQWFACVVAGILLVLGIYRHKGNIQRLRAGNENKIGRKKNCRIGSCYGQ